MSKKKVLVGMSGGVDSSACAAILLDKGYDVYGVTMRLKPCKYEEDYSDEKDAKKVCDVLGIKHFVFDFQEEFKKYVMDYFVNEYINAKTPNPCIACNKHLKFGLMIEKAKELGMDYIATGHYAKIIENNGEYELRMGDSQEKDQSYVLYNLTQEQLKFTLMPLGDYKKEEVRKICEEKGLPVAHKSESMEICFVENDDYKSFIKEYSGYTGVPGEIVDTFGNVLGTHQGLVNYTVGQRKGIGAYGRPMFVLKLDSENNRLILGEKGMEFSDSATAYDVNFLSGIIPKNEFMADVKARYQAKPSKAKITPIGENRVSVKFDTPQRALTPGQAIVFYDGDKVLGGGTIE